jgi:hypothetical protein
MAVFGIRFMGARRALRLAAAAGLAAMLFAQAALVLAACSLDAGAPSRGMALAMAAAAEPQAQCHEQAPATDTLCVAHCQASDQTLDKYQAKVPVLPVHLLPALQVRIILHPAVSLPLERVPAASPPARILFQSLLI